MENNPVKEAPNPAKNKVGAMTMISRLGEDKITHGEDWGTMGKKWRKIAHCSPLPARPNAKR